MAAVLIWVNKKRVSGASASATRRMVEEVVEEATKAFTSVVNAALNTEAPKKATWADVAS